MRCYRWIKSVLVISAVLFIAKFCSLPTYAAGTFTAEQQNAALIGARSKFVYAALEQCYGRLNDEIEASGSISWSDIFKNDSDSVKIPTSIYPDLNDSTLKCKELIGGWHGFLGAGGNFDGIGEKRGDIPIQANGSYSSYDEVLEFLKKIGYEVDQKKDNNLIDYACVNFYKPGEYISDKVCVKVKADGKTVDTSSSIKVESVSIPMKDGKYERNDSSSSKSIYSWYFDGVEYANGYLSIKSVGGRAYANLGTIATTPPWHNDNLPCIKDRVVGKISKNFEACFKYGGFLGLFKSTGHIRVAVGNSFTIDDVANVVRGALYTIGGSDAPSTVVEPSIVLPKQPFLKKKNNSFNDFMTFFIGDKYQKYSGNLTPAEQYTLYYKDLTKTLYVTVQCDYQKPFIDTVDKFDITNWLDGDTMRQDCVVMDKSGSATTAENSAPSSLSKLSVKEIVERMRKLDINDESFSIVEAPEDVYADIPNQDLDEEPNCLNSGGAESMGWILCKVLDLLGKSAKKLYDSAVEPMLAIQPKFFSGNATGGTDSTKGAWETFRGIANFAFCILFVIVIFSQLTGVGIDNYGIKKILPKLIISAILINLSYYICVIAIDLSNIVGNGVQGLLEYGSVELGAMPDVTRIDGTNIGADVLVGVGVLAALITMVGAIWANPAIVLSLLVGALGVVISVCFLFILLSTRQAAAVILTVVSPAAFACYMLPNTKKLFDKWVKMFEGILLLYPLAGLLVGGGEYVSRLLLATGVGADSFWGAVIAMIISIVPVFFIPTILKGSFAAMGNIGAKISGVGKNVRGGVDKKIRNSERFKNTSANWRAGMNSKGELTAFGNIRAKAGASKFARSGVGKALGWGGIAKSQSAGIAAAQKINTEAESAMANLITQEVNMGAGAPTQAVTLSSGKSFAAGSREANYAKRYIDAAGRGDTVSMNAALSAMKSSGAMQKKDIASVVREVTQNSGGHGSNKYLTNLDNNQRATWAINTATNNADVVGTDFELQHNLQHGASVDLGEMGEYAANGNFSVTDVKPEDLAKLSGDSLAAMIAANKVDSGTIDRTIQMNPNMSTDKAIMMGAARDGAINRTGNVTAVAKSLKAEAESLSTNRGYATRTIDNGIKNTNIGDWTAAPVQRVKTVP